MIMRLKSPVSGVTPVAQILKVLPVTTAAASGLVLKLSVALPT
jgi:hypothetical protein